VVAVRLVLKEMEEHAYHHLVPYHHVNVRMVPFVVQMQHAINIQIHPQLATVKLVIRAVDTVRMDVYSKQLIHVTIFGVKTAVHALKMEQQRIARVRWEQIHLYVTVRQIYVIQIHAEMAAIVQQRDSQASFVVHARVVSQETDVKIKRRYAEAY